MVVLKIKCRLLGYSFLFVLIILTTIQFPNAFSAVTNTGNYLYVGDKETNPFDIEFNNDGTKLFVIGNYYDKVHQYSLSTPYDITTATFQKSSSSLSTQDASPLGLTFNGNGTKMFVAGNANDRIYEYTLASAFDVGNITYTGIFVASIASTPSGITFNGDGTKLFVGNTAGNLIRYNLGSAYSLAGSPGYTTISFAEYSDAELLFNNDGTKVYGTRGGSNPIWQHSLTTPYDLTTSTSDGNSYFTSISSDLESFDFSSDGSKIFIVEMVNDRIYQLSVSPSFNLIDSVAPTVSSAATTNSTAIILTMSEVVENSSATASNFVISGAASNPTVSSISVSGTSVTLMLSAAVKSTDTLTVSYTKTSGSVRDVFGRNILANFSNQSVTNNVSATTTASTTTTVSGSDHKERLHRPTFGLSHQTNLPLVTQGFSFNEKSFDITDNWHTDFERQTIEIGQSNTFSAKAYAPRGLQIQEFLFGIKNVGEYSDAELGVEIRYSHTGNITGTVLVQQTNVVDPYSFFGISYPSKCMPNDSNENCITTLVSLRFLEPLQYDVMAIKAIDQRGRTQITYLNEGFDISGDSLNPMPTQTIAGPAKTGLVTVTQNEKYSKYWTAGDMVFERNDFGTFRLMPQPYIRHQDSGEPLTRVHSGFAALVSEQEMIARQKMQEIYHNYFDVSYKEINNIVLGNNTYADRIDHNAMKKQEMIAQQKMQEIYPNYFDVSYKEINNIILGNHTYDRIDHNAMKKQEMIAQQKMQEILKSSGHRSQ